MAQQTAVEWFFRWVNDNPEATHKEYSEAFEQAKQMEKEQRINAQMDMFHHLNELPFGMQYLDKRDSAEQFCETYGSKGSDDHTEQILEMVEKSEKPIIPEISDEEIEEYLSMEGHPISYDIAFIEGAKWYREQLKQRI